MKINKPTAVIFLLVAITFSASFLEQGRIQRHMELPISAQFVPAGQAPVPVEPGVAPVVFESQEDRLVLSFSEPKQRVRRVKIRLAYQVFRGDCLTLHLRTGGGEKPYYLCPGLEGQSGRQVWETTAVTPPGQFKLTLTGEPGLELQLEEVQVKASRSVASGPDFSDRLPVLVLLLALALPVYWRLHRHAAVSQWFLVAVSVTALFIVQAFFAAALLAFLLVLYQVKRPLVRGPGRRPYLFAVILLICVAFLSVFKYAPHWFYSLFIVLGGTYVGLPLGVSYFVFRLMHVVMEWYRSRHQDLSLREYLCFLLFFPTIPAGPIETVDGFYSKRLERLSLQVVGDALTRISLGLFKKVVLVSLVVGPLLFEPGRGLFDVVTSQPLAVPYVNIFFLLCLCLMYAYLDLSAYTDLAIGVGLLFGHRIRENFYWPIFKPNIAEFWRSYHLSLADWCRNNIYFPVLMLTRNTPLALYLSMLTMGLWHHLNLNWAGWGLHHGSGLVWIMLLGGFTHKYRKKIRRIKFLEPYWHPVRVALTFLFAAGGTSLVFIDDIRTALTVYYRYFTLH